MFLLREPSDERVRELLREVADRPFTHPHAGLTRSGLEAAPRGYTLDVYGSCVGRGEADFARARAALVAFVHYPPSFTRVVRLTPTFEEGLVFGTVARHLGFASVHPCRIAFVLDEPEARRFGFGLGTLPGHIGAGEETFAISLDPADERVRYDVCAISRPDGLVARLGRPMLRSFQRRFQRESLAAMAACCGAPGEAVE